MVEIRASRMPMTAPFFSIIIPTFNRHEALAACIKAMGQLDYPGERFEVIIVDDGSLVPVEIGIDERYCGTGITLLRQFNAGPAAARNKGAEHARGEILAFVDDDCIPSKQWLTELAQSATEAPTAIVGGRVVNALEDNPYASASQLIVNAAYAFFHGRNSDLRFFSSNNMAVAAEQFRNCGGFDSSFRFSEDRDFCSRWIRQGKSLIYAPRAIVHHHSHLTLTMFCRQHFNYGRGAFQFSRKRARWGGSFIKPSLQFYAAVFIKALSAPVSQGRLCMAGLMILWQAANLAGFLCQAVRQYRPSANR